MNYIKSEEIQSNNDYRELHSLSYDSILSFVFENIRQKTFSSHFYLTVNFIYLALIIVISIEGFVSGSFKLSPFLSYIFWGFLAGSFLVIPFHEMFHGLAYKFLGAPKIHFGADMKQMLFYVAADKYVVGRKEFYIVALAPFLCINFITIILTFFLNPYWTLLAFTFLLLHNIMCIGDFAMISYFQQNSERELYTFDDHKNRMSYIYEKIG
jgi:hypothetical protein